MARKKGAIPWIKRTVREIKGGKTTYTKSTKEKMRKRKSMPQREKLHRAKEADAEIKRLKKRLSELREKKKKKPPKKKSVYGEYMRRTAKPKTGR